MSTDAPRAAGTQGIVLDAAHPYPGLESFVEAHRAYFFGRDTEAEELVNKVRMRPLTVLHGKSGLGKTSLLQVGVFPRLREHGFVPIRIRFAFANRRAGARSPREDDDARGTQSEPATLLDQVRGYIAEAITKGCLDAEPPEADESLWLYFHRRGFWDASGRPVIFVLVLDQFEEVFAHGSGRRTDLLELVAELSDVVENHIPEKLRALMEKDDGALLPPAGQAPRVRVVIALREDFLADFEDLFPRMPSLSGARTRLGPLLGPAALDAVRKPAPHLVGAEIAEKIIRLVAGARGSGARGPCADKGRAAQDDLPLSNLEVESSLLALYCRELNETRLHHEPPKPAIDESLLLKSELYGISRCRCHLLPRAECHGGS